VSTAKVAQYEQKKQQQQRQQQQQQQQIKIGKVQQYK